MSHTSLPRFNCPAGGKPRRLLAALALLLVSTANSYAQNLLFSDVFLDPNLPGWAPDPGKIAVVDEQLVLSAVYPAFNPNDVHATHLATWHAIPVSGPLADHQTMEFRVDWVGPYQAGLLAGIHALWYDPPHARGYVFFAGEGEAMLAKYWNNMTSFACFFYEAPSLPSEELTLVLSLMRHGENVDITSRILDKANGDVILFEKTVTDTPGSDAALPEGVHGVGVGATDPAGDAWPIQQAPTEIDLTFQWFGDGPASARVVYDNVEVWQVLPQMRMRGVGLVADQFGFDVVGISTNDVAIEACTDLADRAWVPVVTNALADGVFSFTDPQWKEYPMRFYRVSAVQKTDFAHPEALASTAWLEQHLADSEVRIVDCRYPQSDAAFNAGHIPGAVKLDPLEIADPTSAPRMLVPSKEQFESLMSRLGIANSTTVVAYDTDGGLWCARLWYALRYYGHENVKLLNGGLRRWQSELRPIEKAVVSPARSVFQAEAHPEWRATFADVQAAIGSPSTVILDSLSENQHIGKAPDMAGLPAGHIPSARNVPAPSNLDSNHLLRLPEVLAASHTRVGVTPDKEVITYCGGGYYGAFSLFVLHQLGYEQIRLYDGSWLEWIARGGPIETGP